MRFYKSIRSVAAESTEARVQKSPNGAKRQRFHGLSDNLMFHSAQRLDLFARFVT